MDSEGLLLFTNDGAFANALMHPKHEVKKHYEVWVTGYSHQGLERLHMPMELDGYLLKKPEIRLVRQENGKAFMKITIHEGRNRQVRRMCEAAGMVCPRLRRVKEGSLSLGELPLGKWRLLTPEEVEALK